MHCDPIVLNSVTGSHGRIYAVPGADCRQAADSDVATGVTSALKKVLTKGSGYHISVTKSYDTFAQPSPLTETP